MAKIYDFKTRSNKGAEVDFAQFEGKVLMIVNTASKTSSPARNPDQTMKSPSSAESTTA